MKWGMTAEQYALLENLIITPLKNHQCRVYIFGSRVRGTHHSHSDIDLLFKVPANKPLPSGFLSTIKENIEESRFPFTVDLVNEVELAKSYRESVLEERVEL
jgi:predicted nucleotidyltransferase